MVNVIRGSTVTLGAEFREFPPSGPLVNVSGISIKIVPLAGGPDALPQTSVGITNPAVGVYGYNWASPAFLAPGQYVVIWEGTDSEADVVQATEQISVFTQSMSADGPCNWTIDTSCIPEWDALPEASQVVGYTLATYQMWALTGRRFGPCQIAVQPCRQRKRLPLYQAFPVPGWGFYGSAGVGGGGPVIIDGTWFNMCGNGCRCRARCEIDLDGPTDTASVLEVTVRGEVVPSSAYQIQNNYLLVRTDGECWPTCVDYSKQDPPEFTVTYLRGEPLSAAMELMTGRLAYEYALACEGSDECRLPNRLQSLSRQGVSVQVSIGTQYLDFGMTGLAEVDQFIINVNPYRMQQRPMVLSPDRPRPRMVT